MVQKWYWLIPSVISGILGLALIGYGLKDIIFPRPPEVTIIRADQNPSPSPIPSRTIVVDVSGAVESPGVYTLPYGSRISDCLVAAGGLSVSADKNYLARHVNLAALATDGTKIYIIKKGEVVAAPAVPSSSAPTSTTTTSDLVNINTASQSELETLWGIGPARAKSIFDHRPYTSLEELKTKADVPDNVFLEIKDLLTL